MIKLVAKYAVLLFTLVISPFSAALADDADEITAIIRSLAPIAGQSVSPGISSGGPVVLPDTFLPPAAMGRPIRIIIDRRPIVLDYRYSLDLTVYFAYDSAFLSPQARHSLALLGQALQSPTLAGYRYILAGHTDAQGPDVYNMDLSYRRAWAVKRYLMRYYGIASWRLEVVGWGEDYLRDPVQPYDPVNRRVEITLIDAVAVSVVPEAGQPLAPQVSGGFVPALPPCPSGVSGSVLNPDLDLDDFSPEPWVDCDPRLPQSGSVIVQPDGRMIVQP
ncbi:MAG: OmpA family protein [Alphaproteobacteria bacterium]|nr:OmpA family protein [Alphaproteobacteria bacterium]